MAVTYYTNNASFNSHAFFESFDGGITSPEHDVVLDYTTHHIPSTNDNAIISLGKTATTTDVAIVYTAAELSALQGDVSATSHTLVWHVGSTTCTLVGVTNARKESGADVYRATLRVLY
jgi:hypothetical protein